MIRFPRRRLRRDDRCFAALFDALVSGEWIQVETTVEGHRTPLFRLRRDGDVFKAVRLPSEELIGVFASWGALCVALLGPTEPAPSPRPLATLRPARRWRPAHRRG